MDLRSGYPFWSINAGLIATYPPLEKDATCEVAIIGAGITGALVAHHLCQEGIDTVMLDARDVGTGSTCASTGLLQYEVDTPLSELIEKVGKENAERSYLLCHDAIGKIERLANEVGVPDAFQSKKSLYLASTKKDVPLLEREYAARRAIGIELDFLERKDIAKQFSFDYPAALLSTMAGQLDPYRMGHALLTASVAKGLRIYDRTEVTKFVYNPRSVDLTTDREATVRAKHVVFASGFEAHAYLAKKVADFHSTYAFVSEPVDAFTGWGEEQCLIWESAEPYFYLRTTADNRVIMGGGDDPYDSEKKREARLPAKTKALLAKFGKLFPKIELEVAYAWAGTFGSTKDGLAYIGQVPEHPRGYFALGYGGNGITYSVIAAEIIRDLIQRRDNPDVNVFRFNR